MTYNDTSPPQQLKEIDPSALLQLKGPVQESMANPSETDRTGDHNLIGMEIEETYFLEEFALSMRASNIIKKSRLLNLLHFSPHDPEQTSFALTKKCPARISSFINSSELEGRITRIMNTDRFFLNEGLSLASLAHDLAIEPHQLSRFLNIHLHKTFSTLINSYRVDEAKELLLREPAHTVLDIAFASGFNSKASFNRIFKKVTGMTPSEYRLKMRMVHDRSPGG
jgi:AraC-like DNA-binding protein